MIAFAETPQGKSLLRQMESTPSTWKFDELLDVFLRACEHYNSQQHERLASERADHHPAEEGNSMSLEDAIVSLTKALEANTAALGKAPAASTKKDTPAPAPTAAKPKHTREELSAAAQTLKEKTSAENAKEVIGKYAPKLKDVPDGSIDALFDDLEAAVKKASGDDGL